MKKALVLVALACLLVAASPARAATSLDRLERKVAVLQAQVKTLQANVRQLIHLTADCYGAFSVTQFGDSSGEGAFGYVYNTGTGSFRTTAMDFLADPDSYEGDFVWMLVVDEACLTRNTSGIETPEGQRAAPSLSLSPGRTLSAFRR
jgi:hypothetical protein